MALMYLASRMQKARGVECGFWSLQSTGNMVGLGISLLLRRWPSRLARPKRETVNSETGDDSGLREGHNEACSSLRTMRPCEWDTDAGRLRVLRGVLLLAGQVAVPPDLHQRETKE